MHTYIYLCTYILKITWIYHFKVQSTHSHLTKQYPSSTDCIYFVFPNCHLFLANLVSLQFETHTWELSLCIKWQDSFYGNQKYKHITNMNNTESMEFISSLPSILRSGVTSFPFPLILLQPSHVKTYKHKATCCCLLRLAFIHTVSPYLHICIYKEAEISALKQ